MSRKEALKLKKERVRLEALEERLGRLHRQGADEAFLEAAQGRVRDLTPATADLYGQVADRALRRALAGASLPQAEHLLSLIGREERARPLAALAQAALHLAEGRLEEARGRLAALKTQEVAGGAPWPPGLLEALAALCPPGVPEMQALEGLGKVADPGARAVRRLHRALAALQDREFRLRPAEVGTLRRAMGEMRSALPADPALRKLLGTAEELLRLLGELAVLEAALRRRGLLAPSFLERLQALARSLLAALREIPQAALLRPLHHALRLRWREILTLVAGRQSAVVWADLHAALPSSLFALDLEVAGSPQALRNWAAVRELRQAGDYRQLARLLGSLGDAETAPDRLTLLWSLELWAWQRVERKEDDDELAIPAEPPGHAALVRLARMASGVAGRLPSERGPEAARFLRARLFDLCEKQFFCDHSMEAAAALLRQLPDDPGLLTVALTGAASAKLLREYGELANRIAARGAARATDRETLLRLASQIVLETTDTILRVMPSLRLLLGEEAWPAAQEILLRRVVDLLCNDLRRGCDKAGLRRLRAWLELHRILLEDRPELAVLAAALDCVRPEGGDAKALRLLLESAPGLEPALAALRVLSSAFYPWEPPEARKAFEDTRDAAIARLDLRWRLWKPLLPILVMGASRPQIRRLRSGLERLLLDVGLHPEDRRALEGCFVVITDIQRIEKPFRQQSAGAKSPRSKRRRSAEGDQLNMDLF